MIKHKKWYRNFLFIFLSIYLSVSFLGIGYSICKYYLVNIKRIEPEIYTPDLNALIYCEKDSITSFNEYHVTINSFGSRNLFELVGLEEKLVVLLGDSFFWGYGLDDAETISYFLNEVDSSRKYINLALPGANIKDSVKYYFLKWKNKKTPSMIIFQILWSNDIYASVYVEEKALITVEKDYRYILPPFRYIFPKNKLYKYYLSQIYKKIHRDLSRERFISYVQEPLNELTQIGAKLIIVTFGNSDIFEDYNKNLINYCRENGIDCYSIEDLLERNYLDCSLPDGHPSAQFNKALAGRIKTLLEKTQ